MKQTAKLSAGIARLVMTTLLGITLVANGGVTAEARNAGAYGEPSTGISNILSPVAPLGLDKDAAEVKAAKNADKSSSAASSAQTTEDTTESTLVMANVSRAMNVREEPSEDSTKVGVLYKDCGGRIIDRKDGWTKLQSGDLIGWAKDEYLLFDDEAQAQALDVGRQVVKTSGSALNVRAEASEDSSVLGVLPQNTFVEMIEDTGDGWISVDFNDETGYVQSSFVTKEFRIDQGETVAAIKIREEAEKKAALTKNRGKVSADADEVKLLAALIQCEAGNQPYEGKLAVGAVVMNRVKSGAYQNSIYGVIYASGQFTPALNGTVANVYNSGRINDSCYQAAQAAINGETTVGGALHFRRVNGREGIIIGAHVFW
ncbi:MULTISPECIES: SH3 domain-containing protein [unclassified Butyrivibrio]|uniref:SH3 domain-containing protein n=1 Tax=unclassified Butyrivibrio TaxID=2639466 RepID=UPI0003B4B706|nr:MULTISPECIES: SH3 domain-containing protein [unclassified Butyrivibrio]MDC7292445.1 SH3 domain-containing protein [Butyrivibrio sp. DSM 10294]